MEVTIMKKNYMIAKKCACGGTLKPVGRVHMQGIYLIEPFKCAACHTPKNFSFKK